MFPVKAFNVTVSTLSKSWYLYFSWYRIISKGGLYAVKWSLTKRRKFLVAFTLSLYLLYIVGFIFGRLVYTVFSKEYVGLEKTVRLTKIIYALITSLFPAGVQVILCLHFDQVPIFVSTYLQFYKDQEKNLLSPAKSCTLNELQKKTKTFKIQAFVTYFLVVQSTLLLIKKPDEPHHLTSLWTHPADIPPFIRLLITLVHIWWLLFIAVNTLTFQFTFVFGYITCCINLVNVLSHQARHGCGNPLLDTQFPITISSVRIIHQAWHNILRQNALPWATSSIMGIVTLAIYGAITFQGVTAIKMIFVGTLFGVYLTVMMSLCGSLYSSFVHMLYVWKNSNYSKRSKYLRKYLESVPALRVYIGNNFFVDETTVLNLLEVVVTNSASLLLMK